MGSPGREYMWQGSDWQIGCSHICVWIMEEQQGHKTDSATQGSSAGKIKPQNLWL